MPQKHPSPPPTSTPCSPFFQCHDRFARWRADLGLPNQATVENLQKEVKATHLSNYIFDGARADLTKGLSINPLFQVTHSFALGSQTLPPSYNFGAIFANPKVFLQGSVDHEGSVSARFNYGNPNYVTKMQAQLSQQPDQNMIQLEQDYNGQDFSLNLKAINPSPTNLTGIYVGSYLQSITKIWPSDKNWIATAQLQPSGVLQATYWQKLSEKVEVAADLQVLAAPTRRDAIATLGAKYDFRVATFRAQLDSTGKVSALLEQRFVPAFAFLVAGEIDHFKNAAKVGVGVMIESSSLTPEEMGVAPV
ncbi:hypothetical protein NLJ89_g2141 [Agrocybe chaxingu]|uniref:Mitochondrial import receptor subunit TOM40 n=1 Tax=Agrocybe chaxingu TaxID=84603 RepID=A0A9W8MWR9_9AGAR|nr:hypothetical protein NLJ89_g2141 [Agrocybe chaxingu]